MKSCMERILRTIEETFRTYMDNYYKGNRAVVTPVDLEPFEALPARDTEGVQQTLSFTLLEKNNYRHLSIRTLQYPSH